MVLNQAVARLGQAMRETEDQLTRDMLQATSAFINCVGGVNGDNPTEIARSDVDAVVQTLENNNAMRITHVIEGANKFGTGPVREAYFAMGSTSLIGQLEQVQGFISAANYPYQANILSAEWGSIGNLRFLLSSLGSVSPNASLLGANVFNVFVTGMEAYGVIELDGASAEFIYRPLGYGDDPLLLRQSAGYKFAQAQRILNDQWVINMRCTAA